MENEKPILTPEQIERLSEAVHQVWKAVKAMTEAIAVWWEQEIAPQMVIVLESVGVEVNDYSSLAETLQKLSEIAIDMDKYYRETPKRKHRTPYKPRVKVLLLDKRKRVHHCRNNC